MIVIADSNDSTELFIRLGGATAVAKVKKQVAREQPNSIWDVPSFRVHCSAFQSLG
jgi:hypothetical protein